MSDATNEEWDDTAEEIDDLVTDGGGARWPYIAFMVLVALAAAFLLFVNRDKAASWIGAGAKCSHKFVPVRGPVMIEQIAPGHYEAVPVEKCSSCGIVRLP